LPLCHWRKKWFEQGIVGSIYTAKPHRSSQEVTMAKAGKTRVPKKVAGVKVPKTLRKSKTLDTLLGSPFGREVLAGALVAAAGAAASYLIKHRPSRDQIAEAGEAAAEVGAEGASATKDMTQAAAAALAELVTVAAEKYLPAGQLTKGDKNKEAERETRKVASIHKTRSRRGSQAQQETEH